MISVCMATYNGAKYIREQVDSILPQLGDDDELIISDDGSTDDTLSVLKGINDCRIKIVPNNAGIHGVVPNFENALRHATGDIVFFSDQDDIWAENKVKVVAKALQNADLVVHDALIMDKDDNVSDVNYYSLRMPHLGFWNNLYKNSFMGSCMAFRASLLPKVLPFPKHILWHDMWIGLMTSRIGRVKFIDDKLLYYRRHGGNVSATGERSTFSKRKQLEYRLQMLYYVLTRSRGMGCN